MKHLRKSCGGSVKEPCQKVSRVNANLPKHEQWPPNAFVIDSIQERQLVLPPTRLLAGPVPPPQGFRRDRVTPQSPLSWHYTTRCYLTTGQHHLERFGYSQTILSGHHTKTLLIPVAWLIELSEREAPTNENAISLVKNDWLRIIFTAGL